MNRVGILAPLLAGSGAIACTLVVHGAALSATLGFVRRERRIGRAGVGFWVDLRIVAVAVTLALLAHLIEIGAWAVLFVLLGEFGAVGTAFYHSAMNYSTLGYGDIVMSSAWRMLGPLEATNGLLMFGVSTAMIFAVIHGLVQIRFPDLRGPNPTSS
jgi:Ion channel